MAARKTRAAKKPPAAEAQPVSAPVPLQEPVVSGQVRVVFTRDHQHRNVQYHVGDVLRVTIKERERLQVFGAIGAAAGD